MLLVSLELAVADTVLVVGKSTVMILTVQQRVHILITNQAHPETGSLPVAEFKN